MIQGVVFDIQHYAVHDGPGIRTVVYLKGCPLACLWCSNPESQGFAPELLHSGFRCRACLACEQACPRGAVSTGDGTPVFRREACSACGAPCVDACPSGALAILGERMTSDEVMARVAADRAFYANSGGGVTFSGGEPFAQPAFLEELLEFSKQMGIHTAVETCGHADPAAIQTCEPLVDLFLFDCKAADPGRHEALTGRSNALILANLRALAAKAPNKLIVRVPIVPQCTDDPANLEVIAGLLRSLGIARLQLMPYHTLGTDKYASLGRDYRLRALGDLAPRALEEAERFFFERGIACDSGRE